MMLSAAIRNEGRGLIVVYKLGRASKEVWQEENAN